MYVYIHPILDGTLISQVPSVKMKCLRELYKIKYLHLNTFQKM